MSEIVFDINVPVCTIGYFDYFQKRKSDVGFAIPNSSFFA